MEPMALYQEQQSFGSLLFYPVSVVLGFLASYGWYVVGATAAILYLLNKLKPKYKAYCRAKEDAEYYKDPDKARADMEAFLRARERQQALMRKASEHVREMKKEMAEKKRTDAMERLKKYGSSLGRRLGDADDDGSYLPLCGGGSTSTYRPRKKKCPGGGCGR